MQPDSMHFLCQIRSCQMGNGFSLHTVPCGISFRFAFTMSFIRMEAFFSPLSVTTTGHLHLQVYRPVKNTSISFPLILATVTGTFSSASFAAFCFFLRPGIRIISSMGLTSCQDTTCMVSVNNREIRAKISASCPKVLQGSSFLMAVIVSAGSTYSSF